MTLRFWLPVMFEPIDQYAAIAREAERFGFTGVCLADHLAVPRSFDSVHPSGETPFTPETSFPDTFSMLAAMSVSTDRLLLMSYVYIVSMRDPFTVAKQVATVSDLSVGRVRLGVGVGWLAEEFAALGRDFRSRGRLTDEYLEIMADFWDDGYAERAEGLVSFPRAAMFPVPEHPIPVWVGGKSDAALTRAARHNGWLGMNYDHDEVVALLGRLAQIRDAADDRRDDFEVFVAVNALPESALFEELEGLGVTSTLGAAWPPGDRAFASMDAKIDALARFAERFIV
jgi:probable F420-dependent oxidoreductase